MAITVSIGAAVLGVHGTDLQGLLAAAGLALYGAKTGGRNMVCLPGRPEPAGPPGAPPSCPR
jgi:GGDEF domain-containing protein